MKKIYIFIFSLMFVFILTGCKDSRKKEEKKSDSKELELLEDPTFATGFNLLGYSPVVDKREIKMLIDYNKTASPSTRATWWMAQWWTPYNVVDSNYRFDNGKHIYQTPSRTISVNPNDNGYLQIELLGSEEYLGSTRKTTSQPWPHALIEQNFVNSVKLTELEALNVKLDVSIDKCIDKNGVLYNPNMHAAQFLWYFTLRNVIDEKDEYETHGLNGDFLWFGVPIFDSRVDFISHSAHIDAGAPGTTNKLIYSMSSKNYFDEPFQIKKTYTINVDILPYLKEAFIYAINNNALVNCQFGNMEIGYMNLGWELPGAFDVQSTIRNLSVKARLK